MSFVLYVIDFIETELSKLSNIFETMLKGFKTVVIIFKVLSAGAYPLEELERSDFKRSSLTECLNIEYSKLLRTLDFKYYF